MTAFNTSFVSSPAFAASRADTKVASSSKSNNYLVDVVDFENEIHTFEVEAESEEQRAKNRRELEKRVANAKNKIQFCF